MGRVTKHPEERRKELIEAAETLFLEKGFEGTQVRDIVKSLGIAQGTFYYYFKSKDEALTAVLEKSWDSFAAGISGSMEGTRLNALQKLQVLLGSFFKPVEGPDLIERYFRDPFDKGLIDKFHSHFDEIRLVKFKPVIQDIITEGIESKIFAPIEHVEDITEIVFLGISAYMHTYSKHFSDLSVFKRKMGALEELMERILGVEKDSFCFKL